MHDQTAQLYGPDKPCRRNACVRDDPATDGVTAAHLGGAHLDPHDRTHYDGPLLPVRALPHQVRDAFAPLLAEVGALRSGMYPRDTPDTPLRILVEVAVDTAGREIEHLRQQVAHVSVDRDRQVRDASARALDCADHGKVIKGLEDQVTSFDKSREQSETGRLALLGLLFAVQDFTAAARAQQAQGKALPDTEAILTALEQAAKKTSAAHDRAWRPRAKKRPAKKAGTGS